ncbi:hypothetical protein P879_10691 [Paragonimus westermani]|uniref:Peptidase S1 domain-containing protein n=1 Tax=Paragonimus westermani TaxID=34504 RepID=A0A8T0DE24_9TREM|nr:hypothetical protein P879_10691 [Paragonimus westermani]
MLILIVAILSIPLADTHLYGPALSARNKTAKRVINGIPAPDGRVPWAGQMKAVEDNSNLNNCGVTIISTQWLLTAAHCFYENRESYPNQERQILHFHIDRVIMHPSFQPDNLLNDIALIKLRSQIPIDGTLVAIASLPSDESGNNIPEAGSLNYVVGWGCMQVGGSVVDRAQMIELRTNTQEECVNTFGQDLINDVTRFCAGYFQQNRGVCPGDSGSGLMSFQTQVPMVVDIVSAGDKNRASSLPAKFTRVAPFVSWIRQYVG